MGLYGKYTTFMHTISITQMISGLLMIGLGVALRLFVCSWVTDASFGFWVGIWVFFGGLIGHYSAKSDIYGLIGYYVGFNSFSIMLTSMVIFCHSIAWVYFDKQMQVTSNFTNATVNATVNATNTSSLSNINMSMNTMTIHLTPTVSVGSISTMSVNMSLNGTNATASPSSPVLSSSTTSTSRGPFCTHQTWSDYDNGLWGFRLGGGMIILCILEIVLVFVSTVCCYAAANVEPTKVHRRKAIIQGFHSTTMAMRNVKATLITTHSTVAGQEVAHRTVAANRTAELGAQTTEYPTAEARERQMNLYDVLPRDIGREEHGRQRANLQVDNVRQRPSNIYESLAAVSAEIPDQASGDIEMKVLGTFGKVAADGCQVKSGDTDETMAGASTNDEGSCSFMGSLPPPYIPCAPPYPDSD